jgi:hypothetical protein
MARPNWSLAWPYGAPAAARSRKTWARSTGCRKPRRTACRTRTACWTGLRHLRRRRNGQKPGCSACRVARIELAAVFGLSRTEALLLDPKAADCGHCLLVDIRAQHQRSKRRLISLRSAEDRQALDRAVRLFEQVDGGPDGPEGNYRQRLYRLKMLTPE